MPSNQNEISKALDDIEGVARRLESMADAFLATGNGFIHDRLEYQVAVLREAAEAVQVARQAALDEGLRDAKAIAGGLLAAALHGKLGGTVSTKGE